MIETLCGYRTAVTDHYLEEIESMGFLDLQLHQAQVVDGISEMLGLSIPLTNKEQSIADEMRRLLSFIYLFIDDDDDDSLLLRMLSSLSEDRRRLVLRNLSDMT